MAASYPKPDSQKVTRHEPRFGWVELVPRRDGDPPELPSWRSWSAETLSWWRVLWTRPQAAQWDRSGSSLWVLAALADDLFAGRADAAKVSAEMRQHEDRHGLSPKAMLQLRWRLVDEPAEPAQAAKSTAARRKRLRVVV